MFYRMDCEKTTVYERMIHRVVQKKIAQSLMHRHLQPFAVESRGFRQNAQKRSLSTGNAKFVSIG